MSIQKRIQERLDDLGLSMRGASVESGLGPTAVRDILKNTSQSPRLETIVALSVTLKSPLNWLIHGEGDKEFDFEQMATDRLHSALRMVSTRKKQDMLTMVRAVAIMDHLFGDNWESYDPSDTMWDAIKRKIRSGSESEAFE